MYTYIHYILYSHSLSVWYSDICLHELLIVLVKVSKHSHLKWGDVGKQTTLTRNTDHEQTKQQMTNLDNPFLKLPKIPELSDGSRPILRGGDASFRVCFCP